MTGAKAYAQASACLTNHGFAVTKPHIAYWGPRSERHFGSWSYVLIGGRIPPTSQVSGPLYAIELPTKQAQVFRACTKIS